MKKFLCKFGSVALAAVMPLSLLACGNPDNGGTGGGGTGGEVEDPPEVVDKWEAPQGSFTHSDKIMYVKDLGYCTGENAFVDTTKYNMTSTDLGFPFYDSELKRLYVAFGDTNNNKVQGGGNEFQSNVTLYTDNLDFSKGIKWTGALDGQNGATRQVTPLAQRIVDVNTRYWGDLTVGDVTCSEVNSTIPTGVLVLDGTYYMWYMETSNFEDTGEWIVYRNCVVKSADKGKTWSKVNGLNWVCRDADNKEGIAPNFGQIYPMDGNDGYVYIYGIPGGRQGGVKLGRVAYENIENFEEYEYFRKENADGTVDWRKGSNGLKNIKTNTTTSYIVPPMCGELCVTYNAYLQRYIMTYMQGNTSIVVRRSKTPWGKWSDSDVIINQSDLPQLYGGFTNQALMTHDGKRMYMFVSEWYKENGQGYNVHFVEVVFN